MKQIRIIAIIFAVFAVSSHTHSLHSQERAENAVLLKYVRDSKHIEIDTLLINEGESVDDGKISKWVEYYLNKYPSTQIFTDKFVPIVKNEIDELKANQSEVIIPFLKTLTKELRTREHENTVTSIVAYYYDLDLAVNESSILANILLYSFDILGQPAPKVEGLSDKQMKEGKLILIFFNTDCNHCKSQMQEAKSRYEYFVQFGYTIVSISGDSNKDVHEKYISDFPWDSKLCDLKGFQGTNFNNYGVIKTPSIYVIDDSGILVNKYDYVLEALGYIINAK